MEVEFQDENRYAVAAQGSGNTGLIGVVIRMGMAKDAKQAQQVLIGILVTCVVAAGCIWFFTGASDTSLSPEEYMERAQNAGNVPIR